MVLATLENTRNILDVVSPESLEPVVHSFLQALAGNIATSNKVVSSSALLTVETFMAKIPPQALCPALVSLAEHHGSARVRLAMAQARRHGQEGGTNRDEAKVCVCLRKVSA